LRKKLFELLRPPRHFDTSRNLITSENADAKLGNADANRHYSEQNSDPKKYFMGYQVRL
jgi:hypothetical protein